MLTMLFLLFCLNGAASLVNSNEVDTQDMLMDYNKLYKYNDLLVNKIEEKEDVVYRHWDNIPVLSPMQVRDIKNITSDYGYRVHPIYQVWSMHKGMDFSAKPGTKIFSTAYGTVTKIKHSKYGYGNEVIVTHTKGYSTRYAHLNDTYVKKGDKVTIYTCIGIVGSTGLSTGPHLHYEIIKDKKSIDPLYFTYSDIKDRSVGKYFTTLIALESQRNIDKNLMLGMYNKFIVDEQDVNNSKIN